MQAAIIPSVPIRPPGALAGTFTIPITDCEEAWRWVESGQKDGSICEWMVLEEGEVWAFFLEGGGRERMENKREDGYNGERERQMRNRFDLMWEVKMSRRSYKIQGCRFEEDVHQRAHRGKKAELVKAESTMLSWYGRGGGGWRSI